jgi:hypothetical protein
MRQLIVLLLFGGALHLSAQSAEDVQKRLAADAESLRAWTAEKALVDAVRGQNARAISQADIDRNDKAWVEGKSEALVNAVITGPCADKLRELAAASKYGEAFVMDSRGALVCATQKTSDYWQGDEAKWSRAFDGGKGATFIDRPRRDESANANLAQISVPVMDNGKAIGVLTVGVPLGK